MADLTLPALAASAASGSDPVSVVIDATTSNDLTKNELGLRQGGKIMLLCQYKKHQFFPPSLPREQEIASTGILAATPLQIALYHMVGWLRFMR